MLTSHNIIVLSKIKYSDRDLIIKAYSKEKGIVSYILKGVFSSKKSNSKASYFQPLSQLLVQLNYKSSNQLQVLRDVQWNFIYGSLQSNLYKTSIAMFLSELMSSILKEEEPNLPLYEYLTTSFQWLDYEDAFANFHLLFLLKLSKYLGCYPDTSNIDGPFFNLSKGVFSNSESDVYSLSGKNLTILKELLGTNFEALNKVQLNAKQRQSFLNMLLLYFELHLGDFKKPKSLEVFKQVFS